MDTPTEFDIVFRKKIPYWSELLFGVIAAFFTFLFLLYLIMLPADKASGEMQAAYYILVVPEWLKQASGYSFFGLLLLLPVYGISKRHQNASFIIDGSDFRLSGAKMDKTIPVESIRKIMLNDVKRGWRREKAVEVVIKQSHNRTTSFLLKQYAQAEVLVEALGAYDHIAFSSYNDISVMTHDDD